MKYLASDIDGTLMKENDKDGARSILWQDQEMLKEWTKNHILIIATGRNKLSTFNLFENYHLNLKNTFFVTSSGAEIFNAKKECIYHKALPPEVVKKTLDIIFERMNDYPLLITIYNGKEKVKITQPQKCEFENVVNICVESLTQSVEVANICKEKLNFKSCEIHQNRWYVDIVPENISKAQSIEYIIKNVVCDPESYLVAIGDGLNDVCMFEIADKSYTFHFANEEVKAQATQLVDHVYQCIAQEL